MRKFGGWLGGESPRGGAIRVRGPLSHSVTPRDSHLYRLPRFALPVFQVAVPRLRPHLCAISSRHLATASPSLSVHLVAPDSASFAPIKFSPSSTCPRPTFPKPIRSNIHRRHPPPSRCQCVHNTHLLSEILYPTIGQSSAPNIHTFTMSSWNVSCIAKLGAYIPKKYRVIPTVSSTV